MAIPEGKMSNFDWEKSWNIPLSRKVWMRKISDIPSGYD